MNFEKLGFKILSIDFFEIYFILPRFFFERILWTEIKMLLLLLFSLISEITIELTIFRIQFLSYSLALYTK